MEPKSTFDRRKFIKGLSFTLGALVLPLSALSFENLKEVVNEPQYAPPIPIKKDGKLGVAIVGLGSYSTHQIAPALEQTKNAYLAAIVTGTPSKAKAWQKKYNIAEKNIYNYENFDAIASNKDVDIVYIILPNSMHAEYTIRAAKAKKHVICEKPMATNVEDAKRMLDACKENNVQLAIGYRLHYEPFHQRVMELGQKQIYGKVKSVKASNSSDKTKDSVDIWRLDKERAGGGSLMDMGIYAVQGVCYTVGKTPTAITATFGKITNPTVFHDVEESISWQMHFDDGMVAECSTSYSERKDELSAIAEKGWWKLGPAYGYDGKKGETSEGKMDFPEVYEQVNQIDSQAESFRKGIPSITPGEMGYRDMKILMAIYESARGGGKKILIT